MFHLSAYFSQLPLSQQPNRNPKNPRIVKKILAKKQQQEYHRQLGKKTYQIHNETSRKSSEKFWGNLRNGKGESNPENERNYLKVVEKTKRISASVMEKTEQRGKSKSFKENFDYYFLGNQTKNPRESALTLGSGLF